MKEYNLKYLKILSAFFLFSATAFAEEKGAGGISLGDSFVDGGFLVYPNYKAGVVLQNVSTGEYFLDGFPAKVSGDSLELDTVNIWHHKKGLIQEYTRKFGVSISGKLDSGRVVVVDYTCPFSTSYVKKLKSTLPLQEFNDLVFVPVSRNMEPEVISKSLGLQCISKKRAAKLMIDNFTGEGESLSNIELPNCNNEADMYGILNLMSTFNIKGVPTLIEGSNARKNPWSIFPE